MPLLEVRNLAIHFGGLIAVNNINFIVNEEEVLGLIGPNGAGKSTLFNLITSFYKPSKGIIIFNGKNITNMKTTQIAKLGIVRTFQKTSVFMGMSVSRNIGNGKLKSQYHGKEKSQGNGKRKSQLSGKQNSHQRKTPV